MDLPPDAHMPDYYEEYALPVSDPIPRCKRLNQCPLPPVFLEQSEEQNWRCPFLFQENVAQYGGSDYANAVRVERGITVDQAKQIALENPDIDYFVYTKGGRMAIEAPYNTLDDPLGLISYHWVMGRDGMVELKLYRIFNHGDAVFFSGNGIWLGEAEGLADVYHKKMSINTCDIR